MPPPGGGGGGAPPGMPPRMCPSPSSPTLIPNPTNLTIIFQPPAAAACPSPHLPSHQQHPRQHRQQPPLPPPLHPRGTCLRRLSPRTSPRHQAPAASRRISRFRRLEASPQSRRRARASPPRGSVLVPVPEWARLLPGRRRLVRLRLAVVVGRRLGLGDRRRRRLG